MPRADWLIPVLQKSLWGGIFLRTETSPLYCRLTTDVTMETTHCCPCYLERLSAKHLDESLLHWVSAHLRNTLPPFPLGASATIVSVQRVHKKLSSNETTQLVMLVHSTKEEKRFERLRNTMFLLRELGHFCRLGIWLSGRAVA